MNRGPYPFRKSLFAGLCRCCHCFQVVAREAYRHDTPLGFPLRQLWSPNSPHFVLLAHGSSTWRADTDFTTTHKCITIIMACQLTFEPSRGVFCDDPLFEQYRARSVFFAGLTFCLASSSYIPQLEQIGTLAYIR
jgi:hypothetical protein